MKQGDIYKNNNTGQFIVLTSQAGSTARGPVWNATKLAKGGELKVDNCGLARDYSKVGSIDEYDPEAEQKQWDGYAELD